MNAEEARKVTKSVPLEDREYNNIKVTIENEARRGVDYYYAGILYESTVEKLKQEGYKVKTLCFGSHKIEW